MIITFDSSILIDLENNHRKTIEKIKELKNIHRNIACITFISYFEVYLGILRKIERNQQDSYAFLQKFPLIQPTKRTAEILAEMRTKYQKSGKLLPLADLMIAAQVKEHNLLLVTKDKDFRCIDEIKKVII